MSKVGRSRETMDFRDPGTAKTNKGARVPVNDIPLVSLTTAYSLRETEFVVEWAQRQDLGIRRASMQRQPEPGYRT